jgi:thiol-disulfide isomerase/thioredoxin
LRVSGLRDQLDAILCARAAQGDDAAPLAGPRDGAENTGYASGPTQKERTMYRASNRCVIVSIAGAMALLIGGARADGGDKPADAKPILQVTAELTEKDARDKSANDCYCKIYPIELQAGVSYRIDLVSKDFDAFLRLEDSTGAQVAEDDDSGGGLNARIVYKPAKSGQYKIIASTFKALETGKFKLTVVGPPQEEKALGKAIALTFAPGTQAVQLKSLLTANDLADAQKKHYKVFAITLQAGVDYRIQMKAGKTLDPFVRLDDSAGKKLKEDDFGEPGESCVDIRPATTAAYRIVCTSYKAGMTGDFTLSVAARGATGTAKGSKGIAKSPPPKSKVLVIVFTKGQPVQIQAEITQASPTDREDKHYTVHPFEARAGKVYHFASTGKDGFDTEVHVQDAGGKFLQKEDSGDGKVSRIVFVPGAAGRYLLVVRGFKAGSVGTYVLTAREADAGSEPVGGQLRLSVGKPLTIAGRVMAKDPQDSQGRHFKSFAFTVQPGHSYVFQANGHDGFNPQMRVETASGEVIKLEDAGNPGSSRLGFNAGQPATLRLIVASFDPGKTGTFTLMANVVGPPAPNMPPTVAALPALRPVVRTEIASQLTPQDGTDAQGRAYKVFTFQAKADKMYIIEMTGQTFGAQLRLEDADKKLDEHEDFFNGSYSHLAMPPGKGGTYRVIATAIAPHQLGAFTLSITERDPVPPATQKVALGQAPGINSRLTRDDGLDVRGRQHKVFLIEAKPGKVYQCNLSARDFDAELRLEDAKGQFIKKEDFGDRNVSQLSFKLDTAATVRLVVAAAQPGRVGEFTLVVAERDKGTVVPPGGKGKVLGFKNGNATIDGAITDKDPRDPSGRYFKVFTFTATKGRNYVFEVRSKGKFNPFIRVEDETGLRLRDEEFGDTKVSRLLLHAYQGGTYRVVATTFLPGQTGEFTLAAREVEIKAAKPTELRLGKNGETTIDGELTAGDAVLSIGNKVYKEFILAAEAGKTYKIELHSKAFDAYLFLKDSAGKTLAENDDAAPGTLDSRIVHTMPKAGAYHIIVTSLRGGTGPFVLTVAVADSGADLSRRVDALATASAVERKQIVAEVEKHLKQQGDKLTQDEVKLAQRIGEALEATDKPLAAQVYASLGKMLAGASSATIAREGKLMLGAAKRLNLVGSTMEIKGTTTDGKAFNLTNLKGKVVLVDFWATWCPPCKAELPNLRKLYEQYHGKGFEVIGISLDNSEKELTSFLKKEELPWPSIYKEANDIADDYGVFSIPLPILVGRDGRVISLNARGAELGRLLADQFKETK